MIRLLDILAAALALTAAAAGQAPPKPLKIPFSDESLRYSVNWPSGLSLGEALMQSSRSEDRWNFAFSLDASVPGLSMKDGYQSVAAGDFCSAELSKHFLHGKRQGDEKTTFDARGGTATRLTLGGGKSQIAIPACPRDALAFLYYLRHELSAGRLPGPQTVYFGAPYQVRLAFGGRQMVRVNDEPAEADRVTASVEGPASQLTIELYFSRDADRTPVLVRLPLPAGSFSMELVR